MEISRRSRITSVLLATCMLVGAFAGSTSAASGAKVGIRGHSEADYTFTPKTIQVDKGTRVNWSWDSNAPHNVVFRDLDEKSVTRSKASYHLKFNRVGTFKYICTIHGFTGKVVVSR